MQNGTLGALLGDDGLTGGALALRNALGSCDTSGSEGAGLRCIAYCTCVKVCLCKCM